VAPFVSSLEEGFGIYINSLGNRDYTPQDLTFSLNASNSRPFMMYSTTDFKTPQLFSYLNNFGPNTYPIKLNSRPLFPGTIIYIFENNCYQCKVDLNITIPSSYISPTIISTLSSRSSTFYGNSNGVYWYYVQLSRSYDLVLEASLNNLIKPTGSSSNVPPKITLLATQGTVNPITIGNMRKVSATLPLYNSTSDCSGRNSTYNTAYIGMNIPSSTTGSLGIWKFALLMDPAYSSSTSSINFIVRPYSQIEYVYPSSYTQQNTFDNRVNPSNGYNTVINLPMCSKYYCFLTTPLQLDIFFNATSLLFTGGQQFEIYVKAGNTPTMSDYDIKSGIMTANDLSSSSFVVKYLFSPDNTLVLSDRIDSNITFLPAYTPNTNNVSVYLWVRSLSPDYCITNNSPSLAFFTYLVNKADFPSQQTISLLSLIHINGYQCICFFKHFKDF